MTAIVRKQLSTTASPPIERMGAEQVDALFAYVTPSVLAGTLLAIMLATAIHRFEHLNAVAGLTWVLYIAVCAGSHISLYWFYRHSPSAHVRWRYWAKWFTALSLAEGVGWGWAAVGLAVGGGFEVKSLSVIATLGLAAGAIPGYSPYLPAFLALFLPATIPYALVSFASDNEVQQVTAPMALLFIAVVGGLGYLANRGFRQRVSLTIRAEKLAVDLRHQKDIAEEASRAKSSFLAAASHDLRQPIHALSLFVGALRQIPMPRNAERLAEQIDASTTAMDSLFTALLDISRLDAGVVAVYRRPFAIGPMLERVCGDYAGEAVAKGVALSYVPCRATVDSDPALIERIARNLVANAVRYTDVGRIVVGCRRRGSCIAMQVWDTGCGIPHDKQDSVFQEYYQLGNPERNREKGLGLGLAIVRRLTDLLECKLVLRSEPGQGSCFELSIEHTNSAPSTPEGPTEELYRTPATGLVVVIDDEHAIRSGMSSLLTGWGHRVVAAGSASEAIELLSARAARPDLLICDFRLRDGENGLDAINRFRTEYNEYLPAMLITGDTAANCSLEAKANGLVLLYKPVPSGKLRAAISNLITNGMEKPSAQ